MLFFWKSTVSSIFLCRVRNSFGGAKWGFDSGRWNDRWLKAAMRFDGFPTLQKSFEFGIV